MDLVLWVGFQVFFPLVVTFPVTPICRFFPISEATSGRRGKGLKTAAGARPALSALFERCLFVEFFFGSFSEKAIMLC